VALVSGTGRAGSQELPPHRGKPEGLAHERPLGVAPKPRLLQGIGEPRRRSSSVRWSIVWPVRMAAERCTAVGQGSEATRHHGSAMNWHHM
jgi:hypothetical protein